MIGRLSCLSMERQLKNKLLVPLFQLAGEKKQERFEILGEVASNEWSNLMLQIAADFVSTRLECLLEGTVMS